IDLGQPSRFWHMMVDTGALGPGLNFAYLSPMSLGVWGLVAFGVCVALTFLEVLATDGRSYPGSRLVTWVLGGWLGRIVNVVGSALGLFVAGYTGVLLSVSNQPVWSDTYALGGLFLASGLSGAGALLILTAPWRRGAEASEDGLAGADGFFALLELAFLVVLFGTLAYAGQLTRTVGSPWFVLWAIVVLSLIPPLAGRFTSRITVGSGGAAALTNVRVSAAATAVLVLVGMIAMRVAVLWSAQG
ncbi:MAG TPA: NrfD/PsrC family molybdoenzyme membrane anchor subunit, partial [Candidatus Dormibacteraeota bacterium]